jgi:signal transduction histidine kinase
MLGAAKVGVLVGQASSLSPKGSKWKLSIIRLVVAVLLFISAIAFAFFTYYFLWKSENDTYRSQFTTISGELLQGISSTVNKLHVASNSMATSASLAHANSSSWPNASIPGYGELNENILGLANAKVTMLPIVWPEGVLEFEAYAKKAFAADPDIPEETAGYNDDFGFGVFAFDDTGTRYHDTTGTTTFSEHNFLTPIFMSALPATSKAFLFNAHSEIIRGTAIDAVYDCAMELNDRDCFAMTDVVQVISYDDFKPTTLLFSPVFSFNDHVLVGFTTTMFQWDKILGGLLSPAVDSVECVISTDTVAFTIEVTHGVAQLKGGGDLHNTRFSDIREQRFISLDTLVNSSAVYSVEVYSTLALYNAFHSNIPLVATASSLAFILLTMVVVVLYDHLISDERCTKDSVLKHKRDFVRFVSHEVRTPLNSVCLGLRFLEEELQDQLLFFSRSSSSLSTTDLMAPTESGEAAATATAAGAAAGTNTVQQHTSRTEERRGSGSDRPSVSSNIVPLHDTAKTPGRKVVDDIKNYLVLVREIQSSSGVAVSVFNDFLHYDKIEAGTMTLDIKPVPILNVVLDNVKLFLIQAFELRVKVILVFDESLQPQPTKGQVCASRQESDPVQKHSIAEIPAGQADLSVMGDAARIGQVVRNLLSNAIKFSDPQSSVTVNVGWRVHGLPAAQDMGGDRDNIHPCGSVLLSVTDSGPGMSPADLSSLFQEGVQFNPNELQGGQGSGLGLWISKGIIDLHRGHLWAESPGLKCGCSFFAELPAVRCSERRSLRTVPSQLALPALPRVGLDGDPARFLSVLVVDDSPTNRKCAVRLLQRRNYQCSTAEDGLEAVNIMQSEQGALFDCILMDYEMPKVSTVAPYCLQLVCFVVIARLTSSVCVVSGHC